MAGNLKSCLVLEQSSSVPSHQSMPVPILFGTRFAPRFCAPYFEKMFNGLAPSLIAAHLWGHDASTAELDRDSDIVG